MEVSGQGVNAIDRAEVIGARGAHVIFDGEVVREMGTSVVLKSRWASHARTHWF